MFGVGRFIVGAGLPALGLALGAGLFTAGLKGLPAFAGAGRPAFEAGRPPPGAALG